MNPLTEQLGVRFSVDPLKLDEEWQSHPQMVYNASKEVADRQYAFDCAKTEFEQTKAELSDLIRRNPEQYTNGKATVDAIASAVILQPEYRRGSDRVDDARHTLGLAQAASTALEHRKRALTMMVELYVREYYSDPSPRPVSEKSAEYAENAAMSRMQKSREVHEQRAERQTEDNEHD